MEAPPDAKLDWLRRTRPHALFAWAAVLDELSRRLEEQDGTLHVPLVFSTSTALYPPVRARVAARLQASVFDVYGAVETGPMAWDCPEGGYHVRHDATIVELLDEAGRPAERGRVAVTPLWRRALPLIRADLGDLAEWDPAPCRCGVPGPRLRALHGRAMDLVRLGPDGAWVAPFRLLAPMYWLPGIRQFQMVQETPDRFTLHVVGGPDFDTAREGEAADYYRREFGDGLRVTLCRVDTVPQVPGGKPLVLVTLARRNGIEEDLPVQGTPEGQPPWPAEASARRRLADRQDAPRKDRVPWRSRSA
jgi:phenylacetate-CoA ligase